MAADTLAPKRKRSYAFRPLRLVSRSPAQRPAAPIVPLLRLSSFLVGESKDGRTTELTALASAMAPLDQIHFVHRLLAQNAHPFDYEFEVAISAQSDLSESNLRLAVPGVLSSVCPSYCFSAPPSTSSHGVGTDWSSHLNHAAAIYPIGAFAGAKPAPDHLKPGQPRLEKGWSTPELDSGMRVPFAGDLPSMALGEALVSHVDAPPVFEVRIVLQSYELDAGTQARVHTLIHRVEAGQFGMFHPQSPITPYSADGELAIQTTEMLRAWLRRPQGFVAFCVVRSSSTMSDMFLSRIGANVFGRVPFEVESEVEFDEVAQRRPSFHQAFRPSMGLPAVTPAISVLSRLGVSCHYAAPQVSPPGTGSYLGDSESGQHSVPVALPFDVRSRHTMILGASGAGKSTLMLQMISEDLRASHRPGICVIDPHGDVAEKVLSMIPEERRKDVILLDLADTQSTLCINPMEGMRDDPVHAQYCVSELMGLIDMLFENDNTTGPMLRSNLRALILLAASVGHRNGTLLDALRILEDSDYRDYLLGRCKDQSVVAYWRRFMVTKGSDHGFDAWIPYLMARLGPFTANPVMKRLICRPDSSIDLAKAMNDRRIFVVKIAKSVLQEDECKVLGAILLMKFFAAAMTRAGQPEHQRVPFHLYIDEAQSFATDSFPRMLAEARKFNLCITTANQNLSQLRRAGKRGDLVDSLIANTASKFLFRLGPGDQSLMAPYYKPQFDETSMGALPDFFCAALISNHNRPIPPFVLRANNPAESAIDSMGVAALTENARRQFGTPIEQANEELARNFGIQIETLTGAIRAQGCGDPALAS